MSKQQPENVTVKRKSKMIVWISLLVALAIFASIALRIDDWGRDWTQNTASTDANSPREGLRPVVLDASAEAVIEKIHAWADSDSRWQVVGEDTLDSSVTLKLTRTTPIMRFVDDVEVTITNQDQGGVIVNATSRSRVGKGDLGQNPRNLIELTSMLK